MFENGLQYVRADFHLHTCKDKEFVYSGEQNSFVNDYVSKLKLANINVGIITNHNKFDKDEYNAIRKAAKKQDIFILPGVELTIKEGANGIHTLIVFNPEEWLESGNNHIQTFLTAAFATIPNPENRNVKSIYDLKKVFEQLDAYGRDYFVVFAHVDQNSGIFSECKGGLLESLAGLTSFKNRVLGLQKSRSRDNLNQFERCFGFLPALVEGSDPKSITDIGKGDKCTYLKIGEYSFAAIKFALQDYRDRVSENIPENKHGFIESISFQGGKFDGQTITFSRELNALIGIRGSGKSSILEAVRYVLGLTAQMDKDYKDSLVKNVFGSGGKATLNVVDKHGKRYFVSRIFGERINVLDESGNDLNINPISLFDGVQYFGQKDLSGSADHENSLLEKLISGRIGQPSNLDSLVSELVGTVERLLDVSKIPQQMVEATTQQTELEHKLSIFEEKGVADKLKKQRGYTTDTTKLDTVKKRIDSILRDIRNAFSKSSIASSTLDGYSSEFNTDIFEDVSAVLSLIDVQLTQIGSCIAEIEKQCNSVDDIISHLKERTDSLADEFAEIKREIKDETLDVDSFVKMTAELQKTKEKLQLLSDEASSKSKIEASFTKAARERNDVLLATYNAYISSHTGVFGVEREEWDAVRGVVTLSEQADTEKLFLENPQDAFLIYQIRRGGELDAYRFMNYDYLQSKGVTPERGGYDAIYTGGLADYGDNKTNLDMIYQRFNVDHPADFKGHSLSVSDIVALKQNGVVSCHYVDSIGFRELPNFLKPENYLKNAEMLLEDDYGMIDGIINNGPKQPTVTELEEQVKAGFSISLTELAAASHREQKKPSVLEKLRERTPEQAKNKTAPKRSAEREL